MLNCLMFATMELAVSYTQLYAFVPPQPLPHFQTTGIHKLYSRATRATFTPATDHRNSSVPPRFAAHSQGRCIDPDSSWSEGICVAELNGK